VALRHLAQDLGQADFRYAAVQSLLGPAAEALGRDQVVPALWVLDHLEEPHAPLPTLVRVFLLGASAPTALLDAALPSLGARGALRLGLLEPATAPGEFRAAVDLRPYAWDEAEAWVASDLGAHQRAGVLRHDHVLGIGRASLTLAGSTVRRPAARALDLGTGCGIQTFHLLSHCDHVTATDLSARALGFTRFNLVLNADVLGLDPEHLDARVTLRAGSLLEPVQGELFDLVVSNPPFVITPRRADEEESERFTYRDGGLPGDQLVATLVRALPDVLEPGGTAQLLANWEIGRPTDTAGHAGTSGADATGADTTGSVDSARADVDDIPDWAAGPAAWIRDDLECWVIQRDLEDPTGYAETWLQDASQGRDPQAAAASYRAYLEDFASRNVEGIGLGLVWLRRPGVDAPAGVGRRYEEITHAVDSPLGPVLAEAIMRADALAAVDPSLLHAQVAPDVTVETHARPGAEHPEVILLRQGAGLRRVARLDTALAGLVSACDGELALGSIARAVVALLGAAGVQEAAPAADPASALVDAAAGLLRDGFLRFPPPSE